MKVGVAVHFDAAHYLPNYHGKCVNIHGHTWHVEVTVCDSVNEDTGMVVDLVRLKGDVNGIIAAFDHQMLNDCVPFANNNKPPTCENLVLYIHDRLIARYNVDSVKVREGEGGWAEL